MHNYSNCTKLLQKALIFFRHLLYFLGNMYKSLVVTTRLLVYITFVWIVQLGVVWVCKEIDGHYNISLSIKLTAKLLLQLGLGVLYFFDQYYFSHYYSRVAIIPVWHLFLWKTCRHQSQLETKVCYKRYSEHCQQYTQPLSLALEQSCTI